MKKYFTVFSALILAAAMLIAASRMPRAGHAGINDHQPSPSPRIVSLAPSITEILFALGLGDELVGVTAYCDYPPEALTKPHVGDFKGTNLEALIALRPDLVIATRDGNLKGNINTLEQLGIRLLTYQPADLHSVIVQIESLGRELDREKEALALAAECRRKLFFVQTKVQAGPRVKVLFAYGREPLVLAGPGTFADDMIRIAGGENIAADAGRPYPRFSMEEVVARGPEVIIESGMGSDAAAEAAAREFWSRWPGIPAVKSGRVVVLDENMMARPGPRIFDGLLGLARALHPERFGPERFGEGLAP